ncbi:MAG: response regulator [Williamsia sp.]|nr:response regulator [Williamsia sp.]
MTATDTQKPLVLFVEDDEDDQEFIALAFDRIKPNPRFHITSNGREALQYLSGLPANKLPCLIVLDLNMPVLNGVETLEALKSHKQWDHIPRVVLTTSNSPRDKDRCLLNGATDYLVKPNNMMELIKTIRTMLHHCD